MKRGKGCFWAAVGYLVGFGLLAIAIAAIAAGESGWLDWWSGARCRRCLSSMNPAGC